MNRATMMNMALNLVLLAAAILGAVLTYLTAISIELFMLLLLVVSGIVALLDRFALRKKRAATEKEPLWVEYCKSFFPVIVAVFLLRSFLAEPFKIPSGSMIPTLQVGDYILVNKFTYGIRLPVANIKIMEVNNPQRGDVMVFRFPDDPSQNFIKRVVGLPGDVIEYRNKQLTINGVVQQQTHEGEYNYFDERQGSTVYTQRYAENLSGRTHPVLIRPEMAYIDVGAVEDFPFRSNCNVTLQQLRCTVPPGHYFMMGDNRDNSRDSRFWGFVPDKLIVGKAFAIWFNWGELKRIGSTIN
jgi:signal peptidase I